MDGIEEILRKFGFKPLVESIEENGWLSNIYIRGENELIIINRNRIVAYDGIKVVEAIYKRRPDEVIKYDNRRLIIEGRSNYSRIMVFYKLTYNKLNSPKYS